MKVNKKLMSFLLAGVMAVMSCGAFSASADTPDPNGDGKTNISDAVYIMQYLKGGFEPTNLESLDANKNGVISRMDAIYIQLYEIGTLP